MTDCYDIMGTLPQKKGIHIAVTHGSNEPKRNDND